MSDSGENFFRANKQSRNDAFHFLQGDGEGARDGDQSAYLHPTPAVLGLTQKVGVGDLEPAPPLSGGVTVGRLHDQSPGTGNV